MGFPRRVALVVLAGLLAACQSAGPVDPTAVPSTATATPLPESSPDATPSPSPTAKPSPTPTAARLRRDSFVTVVTDDLRVRSKPGVSSASVKLEPLLWTGALAFVINGPVAASGYNWYLIHPLGEVDLQTHPDPPRVGWVAAAGKDGEPWLGAAPIDCVPDPLDGLRYDLVFPPIGLQGLACFGNKTLQFVARLGRREAADGRPWVTSPAWLDPYNPPDYVLADPDASTLSGQANVMSVALDPAVKQATLPAFDSTGWVLVNVTGRYDHPAARTCRPEAAYVSEEPKPPAQLVVLDCRARFVMTSVTSFDTP